MDIFKILLFLTYLTFIFAEKKENKTEHLENKPKTHSKNKKSKHSKSILDKIKDSDETIDNFIGAYVDQYERHRYV